MTSGLCNPEYYRGAFMEIRKFMEVREEGMEVQEEAAVLQQTERPHGAALLEGYHLLQTRLCTGPAQQNRRKWALHLGQ